MNALEQAGVNYYLAVEEFARNQQPTMNWMIRRVLYEPNCAVIEAAGISDFTKKFDVLKCFASRKREPVCIDESQGLEMYIPLATTLGLGSLGMVNWVKIQEVEGTRTVPDGFTNVRFFTQDLDRTQASLTDKEVPYIYHIPADNDPEQQNMIALELDVHGHQACLSPDLVEAKVIQSLNKRSGIRVKL